MKRIFLPLFLLIAILFISPSVFAVEINLFKVENSTPEAQKLAGVYGPAYGFTPQQAQPAMWGNPTETPAVLKIAQAAGTVPMTVWMMRKLGYGYGDILSNFALAPATLFSPRPVAAPPGYWPQGYSPQNPWSGLMNPMYGNLARTYFLKNILRIPNALIPQVPWGTKDFANFLFKPRHQVHGTWMPPGIAKKYGLWMPPGQAKKHGWWGAPGHPGKSPKGNKHSWKHASHPSKGKKDSPAYLGGMKYQEKGNSNKGKGQGNSRGKGQVK